jgi:hypothetical protein
VTIAPCPTAYKGFIPAVLLISDLMMRRVYFESCCFFVRGGVT